MKKYLVSLSFNNSQLDASGTNSATFDLFNHQPFQTAVELVLVKVNHSMYFSDTTGARPIITKVFGSVTFNVRDSTGTIRSMKNITPVTPFVSSPSIAGYSFQPAGVIVNSDLNTDVDIPFDPPKTGNPAGNFQCISAAATWANIPAALPASYLVQCFMNLTFCYK